MEEQIWDTLHSHLKSIFTRDTATYADTTSGDLSLYEWWVTPHRQDGLDFHLFMIENAWAGASSAWRYDLLEPRLQVYGDTAVVSYTLMVSTAREDGITHRTHNESRVLVKREGRWQIVHVHKSPAWPAPYQPAS
ncbi:MAG TPA: nuclear transport factor 2 family protein [Anaerolineae bacterium]|nr:nuclear transport factor 2 family protein [Anaerolineae bacterium]